MEPRSSVPDNTSKQQSPVRTVQDPDVHGLIVLSDPFELFEGTQIVSSASAHARGSRNSDASFERLDRLEGLLEGLAQQQTEFLVNQRRLEGQLKSHAEESRTPPSENSYDGSNASTGFIRARDRRMRMGSLDAPRPTAAPTAPMRTPLQYQPPQQQQQVPPPHVEQPVLLPVNFGVKIQKPRNLDWPKFSGKETYAAIGADFKSWGLRFLQRLGAAQQMSGGDWPEEFKILMLNGKLDGTVLVYFEKMLPGWTAVSNSLEYVINSMLIRRSRQRRALS
ncbi:hypothetical protein L916_16093 [Phytophthora nicotianae]|uniref:Uncharacterized protein n=1 Tax=Phytophthora nicotianae TaxID=4792 RepID=W2ICA7_PHYNI|nr:hypothetical protein L916_16093 [Phytophthora nicotianae]